ncbi:hypothetical protein FocTR4_00016662 [Fusarium oxysporum f. sp. cubense]|uniref:Uncharacterized protein n=1 Tax=Fusarium oxysporum f. sp. cubense TaxID=61366 RepID=A0A5C6SB06_FUSOC|nr:hypothetical protein FocTR4_00016662 [Fusarium oxysporum f. sp. cubense]
MGLFICSASTVTLVPNGLRRQWLKYRLGIGPGAVSTSFPFCTEWLSFFRIIEEMGCSIERGNSEETALFAVFHGLPTLGSPSRMVHPHPLVC